jgi:hypothetical protein
MRIFVAVLAAALVAGCATSKPGRERCASLLDSAWAELDFAKAEGFAGSVSYGKAAALLTHAKGQQTLERFPSCIDAAGNARFYIAESRKGR